MGQPVGPGIDAVAEGVYEDNRVEMLDHIRTREVASKVPAGGWMACREIDRLAATMGVLLPAPGPWLAMLCELAERIPHAMLVVNMRTPGLPITFCNTAMVDLTGYAKGSIYGQNCRFLQGPSSEAAAVRAMVVAVRTATPTHYRCYEDILHPSKTPPIDPVDSNCSDTPWGVRAEILDSFHTLQVRGDCKGGTI